MAWKTGVYPLVCAGAYHGVSLVDMDFGWNEQCLLPFLPDGFGDMVFDIKYRANSLTAWLQTNISSLPSPISPLAPPKTLFGMLSFLPSYTCFMYLFSECYTDVRHDCGLTA